MDILRTIDLRPFPSSEKLYKDAHDTLQKYPTLRPALTPLLTLAGTLPVTLEKDQRTYQIPIKLVYNGYPSIPPEVFVTPTATMEIRTSENVEGNGKCSCSVSARWKKGEVL